MTLTRITDRADLVPTVDFPYAKFLFENFNPVQSGLIGFVDTDTNFVCASATSSGKTVVGELFISHAVRKLGKKGVYLSPLKALSQEKYDEWTDPKHHFSDLKVAICTGDYQSSTRKKELDEADIVILTSEMLNSLSRNFFSEKNQFLARVGTVVVDEMHLLGTDGRGAHLESGLMKFTEGNPNARIIGLSATMPNVDEVGKWLTHLNKKQTVLLESDYRPCKLNVHFERYWDMGFGYDASQEQLVSLAIKIVNKFPEDKFILFVHSKATGALLQKRLNNAAIENLFHNASLEKAERIRIERRFREDAALRVIVATSGLAQGLNMPARRVVVVGIHRGTSEVETSEIKQECGRAGRPQYDPEGDAYVLVPSKKFQEHVDRLTEQQYISSQMGKTKTLAFHLVSEIHHKNISSMADVRKWYSRTLAHFQNVALDESAVQNVLDGLVMCGCVRMEDGEYRTTSTGNVASMFYCSPYDVADLSRNFSRLFSNHLADDDVALAMALGNLDSHRVGIVNRQEMSETADFNRLVYGKVQKALSPKNDFNPAAVKAGYCYYLLLRGEHSAALSGQMRTFQADFGRTAEVLSALDKMGSKWSEQEFINTVKLRVAYGVETELVPLCGIKGIGKVKAKRLYSFGLRKPADIRDAAKVKTALNCTQKAADEVVAAAKVSLNKPNHSDTIE